MNLLTAQGAVTALKDATTLGAAYATYDAAHDDKHRKSGAAYGYNFEGASGNEAAGYYQVTRRVADPEGPIRVERAAWGKVTVETYSLNDQDLTKDDEKRMLLAAFKAGGSCYRHPNGSRFHYAVDIPAGYKGFVFRGGGRVYPKMADPAPKIVIVVSAGGTNLAIVTHFPEMAAVTGAMTPLT